MARKRSAKSKAAVAKTQTKQVATADETMEAPKFKFENLSLPSPLGAQVRSLSPVRDAMKEKLSKQGVGYWQDKLEKTGPTKWTPVKIQACLNAIATFGVLIRGAQAAGMSYRGLYSFMERDPYMKLAVEEAVEQHRSFVEELVYRRGVEGWYDPVVNKGRLARDHEGKILYVHKYDAKIFEMYVKRFAHEYRDKSELDINLNKGGGVLIVDGMAENEEDFDKEFAKLTYDDTLLEGKSLPVIDVTPEKQGNSLGRG